MAASIRLIQKLVMDTQNLPYGLTPESTPGATIEAVDRQTWRLSIPPGPGGRYRLAQLDNYRTTQRSAFPHRAPISLELEGRASASNLPGTWGFGFWNDPFSMGAMTGNPWRFPELPNTAWVFFASPENSLSLRDNLPESGGLVATFQSPRWPAILLAPGILALPLMAFSSGRRLVRRLAARIVRQEAISLAIDPVEWHSFQLEWHESHVRFAVDGETLLYTKITPIGPLGMVIWIDNQYAAFRPDGSVGYGTLPNRQPAWIEVRDIRLKRTSLTSI